MTRTASPTVAPTVILTAHGSTDPRSAASTRVVAAQLQRLAPDWAVRVSFCEHNRPTLAEVLVEISTATTPGAVNRLAPVIAPFLLTDAYHARTDIPALAAGAAVHIASALGEDDRLITVLANRLGEAGASRFDPSLGVVVVAVGSSHPEANARVAAVAQRLADRSRWAATQAAFATGPGPSVDQAVELLRARGATRLIIAPWFLAPGRILSGVISRADRCGIPVAAPLGAHRLVAAAAYDRIAEALAAVRAA